MPLNEMIIKLKTMVFKFISLPKKFLSFIRRNITIAVNNKNKKSRTKPQLFLIGTPNHGNLGDQLIAVAELSWLQDYYPDYEVKEFTHETLMKDKNCRMLLSQIKKEDLILFHGGGNLNVLYLNCEKIRRKIIEECPENRIILFQQSIFYEDTEKGRAVKAETQRIYNQHKNFTVIARENGSYEVAKEMFRQLHVYKYPDMATYLFGRFLPSAEREREGVILCIRKDEEKYYNADEMACMKEKIAKSNLITISDTHIGRAVLPEKRKEITQSLVDEISKHRVTVTDRFHGVVFSILAGTPCVVLRSSDHKIVEGVKWFKDVEGVFYAENIDDVPMLVEKAKAVGRIETPDFTHYFNELYNELNI